MEYVSRATLWMDMRIVACTIVKLVGFPGERVVRWLKLDRSPVGPESLRSESLAEEVRGEGVPVMYRAGMGRPTPASGNGKSAAAHAKDTVPTT